jgi:signal transduction histidine kinase
LQDGHDTLFALTQQGETLRPGDRVEIAGFSGHERGKFLLREAFFRFLAHGVEPAVLPLPAGTVNVDWDGLLTKATGTLLNVMQKDDHVRLLVRNGGSTFEADMESVDARTAEAFRLLPLGSRLALTGVYEVQHDEYDRPATFLLMLRSWSDVRLLERPSWWTLPRLLVLLAIVMVVFVISLAWGILISRKNRLLRQTRDQLQLTNQELESFSYSVSHDLRAPLRAIDGFSLLLLEHSADHLDDEGRDQLKRIRAAAQRMGQLIEHLLALSRHARAEVRRQEVDLSALARAIAAELQMSAPARQAEFVIAPSLVDQADPALIRAVLENLLGNAWKFSGKQPVARIEFGRQPRHGSPVYFVRDNGTGFNMAYAKRLFGAFQRLHAADEFPGTGIGLATVQRIIHRHHGRVWAESAAGQGATFYFTLSS